MGFTSHWEKRLASAASQAARQLAESRKARTGASPVAEEGTGARSRGRGLSKVTTVVAGE
jgi:hypothetical protein